MLIFDAVRIWQQDTLPSIMYSCRYPDTPADNTLNTLAGAKCFFTLDLKSGYWQVEVHDDDRDKTTFCTHEGLS